MKLTDKSLSILKAFAGINPNILIESGNVLKTIASNKHVFARATLDQEFDETIGIYDLNRFLGTISLFSDPELEITPELVTIGSGKNRLSYRTATANSLVLPPAKPLDFKAGPIKFALPMATLNMILKVSSQLSVLDISLRGADGVMSLVAHDISNPSSTDSYSVDIGETDLSFQYDFKVENFKFIQHDYNVEISPKKIAHFTSEDGTVEYWVAAQHSSQVES